MKRGLVLILIALSLSEILISAGADTERTNSSFDMKGTITNVLTPSSIVIGSNVVNLEGVDSSGLYRSTYYLPDGRPEELLYRQRCTRERKLCIF